MKKYLLGILLFILIFSTTGCKKSIVGKWKSIDTKNEYYYIFNKDKTCSYEMKVARLNCTYEENDSKLTIHFAGNEKPNTYEYRFEKKTLIIRDDAGKDNKFIKEK
jgi:hypothetical protein